MTSRHRIAATVVALGWSTAVAVYVRAAPGAPDEEDAESTAEAYDMTHSKRYLREVERIGGKANVLAAEVNDAVAALFRGRTLAYTIAVASAATAGAYLGLARVKDRVEAERKRAAGIEEERR